MWSQLKRPLAETKGPTDLASSSSSSSSSSSTSDCGDSTSDSDGAPIEPNGSAEESRSDDDGELSPDRKSAIMLLKKCLSSAGASSTEVESWVPEIEKNMWNAVVKVADAGDNNDYKDLLAALRLYKGEVRRVNNALKNASVANALFARVRAQELEAGAISLLPPEELLPKAKRARLQDLRAKPPEESGRMEFPYKDDEMACPECGKKGFARYRKFPGVQEGCGKPESWGGAENDNRGDRCQATCTSCLAEWVFEL